MKDLVFSGATAEADALANLAHHAAHTHGAYAPNSERALRSDVARFSGWCADRGLPCLPASPATVAAYIDALAHEKAPATIRRAVSSIATLHRAAQLASPTEAIEVKLALKRLHRAKGRAQAQAAPMTRDLVVRMLAAAGTGSAALRNRALVAVAYDTLCRRSELVALRCTDLEASPAGDGTVTVRKSKTDQEGAGTTRFLAADTMREVAAWLAASGITDGPLFRSVGKAGTIGGQLDAGDVARIFKKVATASGVTPEEVVCVSGHSSRVGAAQDMVRHGVELPAVMQAGGWRTPEMVARYTRRLDARRSGAAKLAMLQKRE